MKLVNTELPEIYIIEPTIFSDERGWFYESWSERKFLDKNLHYNFLQDNHSYSSSKGVLRGIHFQSGEAAQAKLVRCARGAVLDVVVDLRKDSPTYKKWISVELSAENKRQLIIPRGFGHGFVTLTDEVEFLYKADNLYNPTLDRNIIWNDRDLNISWGIDAPILSDKDSKAPTLKDSDYNFEGCL